MDKSTPVLPFFDLSQIKETSKIAIIGSAQDYLPTTDGCAKKPNVCAKSKMVKRIIKSVPHFKKIFYASGLFDSDHTIDNNIGTVLRQLDDTNVILLDDVIIGTSNVWKNFQQLMFNSHYKKNLLIVLQSLSYLPPSYRAKLDYIFMRMGNNFDRNRLYNYIDSDTGVPMSWDQFNQLLDDTWYSSTHDANTDGANPDCVPSDDCKWIVLDNTLEQPKLYYYSKVAPPPVAPVNIEAGTNITSESMIDTIWRWITWQ